MPAADTTVETVSPKRDRLMATAWRLFYRDGYRAVGIDTLLAEAEVAKMTLYNHFDSKEALIVAVLEKRSAELYICGQGGDGGGRSLARSSIGVRFRRAAPVVCRR